MNTDQQEMAVYQRAVETAKNEIAILRRRAEQAEALALTLQQQRDAAEADAAALLDYVDHQPGCPLWNDLRGVCTCGFSVIAAADHPGADLLAVANAAAAFMLVDHEREDIAALYVELKNAIARWKK